MLLNENSFTSKLHEYSLTPYQQDIWIKQQVYPSSALYNIGGYMEIRGEMDLNIFQQTINILIKENDALRIIINEVNGEPTQKFLSKLNYTVPFHDFSEKEKSEEYALQWLQSEMIKPFDLNNNILFQFELIKVNRNLYYWFIKMHHIIADGWAISLINKNVIKIYNKLTKGEFLKSDNLYCYKNLTLEDKEYLNSKEYEEDKIYWKKKLEVLPDHLIMKKSDIEEDISNYIVHSRKTLTIKPSIYNKIIKISKENNCSAFHFILGAMYTYFSNIYDKDELIIGIPVLNRRSNRHKATIGLFVNLLPLKIKIDNNLKFIDFVVNIKKELIESYKHEKFPLGHMVREVYKDNKNEKNLFDIVLSYLKHDYSEKFSDYETEYKLLTNKSERNALTICVSDFGDEKDINIDFDYNLKVFEEGLTIDNVISHFRDLLYQLSNNPYKRLCDIEIITEDEKRKVLYDFNGKQIEYFKDKTIQELFEEQVEDTPNNIAVIYGNNKLTYRELNAKANKLARVLRENGVKTNSIVGIMLERSLEMIVGMLGVLKAGGAYLPIEPEYPKDRIEYMIQDSKMDILLTSDKLLEKINYGGKVLEIDDKEINLQNEENLKKVNTGKDLAYIIYTSGSTGKPKGVMIEHKNVAAMLQWRRKEYKFGSKDSVLQLFSNAFDGFVTSFYTPIISGAKVVILSDIEVKDVFAIKDKILTHNITHFITVPSMCLAIMEYLTPKEGKSLRIVTLAGETLTSKVVERCKSVNKEIEVINEYGPTENTVVTTIMRDVDVNKKITIGKPKDNARVFIVDKNNKLQPIGVAGELCISGDGIARGYLNKPELTKEKFILNPFEPNTRMYKTGDLARWLPDGNIEFLGRIDHQVKIRGFRTELGEIESQLLKNEKIKEAAVIAREDEEGNKTICAYIVGTIKFNTKELRKYLLKELPEYMIPSYFIQLDRMPVMSNGKIDRKNLPEPKYEVDTGVEYEAARDEIEKKLVEIWGDILKVDRIGINDNFFEIGGHSLKATSLINKICKELNVEISFGVIFRNPTIKSFGKYIRNLDKNIYLSIENVEKSDHYALSSAQKRMYILNQTKDVGISYNIPMIMIIEGKLNISQFEKAMEQLIKRHESFRTAFQFIEGEPVQKVYEEVDFKIIYDELKENKVKNKIEKFIRPFDLSKAPLLRIELLKLSKNKHLFMMDTHHIVSDGVSTGIFIKEFISLYEEKKLPKLRIQYKDFSHWQNNILKSKIVEKQKEYWLNKFKGEIPELNMPTDYTRLTVRSFEGDIVKFEIEKELVEEINKLAAETGTTLYMILLGAYNVLLSKYTGQEDIVVGTPLAGRRHSDLDNIIGMFVNTVAMRNYPKGEITFKEFLETVKNTALEAYENQDYQFEELINNLDINRSFGKNPLFDVMFTLQNINIENIEIEGLKFSPYEFENKISKFDITLNAIELKDKIIFKLEYCTKLFKKETIERLSKHYINILKEVTNNVEIKLSDVEILSQEEKKHLIYDFNNTKTKYPRDKTIHELFEEQVKNTPNNIAIVYGDKQLTYSELNKKSNYLAKILRDKGVKADTVVGIMVEKSLEMIIGILGILKAGGAYLPIDAEYPQYRIKHIINDSNAKILLSKSYFVDEIDFSGEIIDIENSINCIEDLPNLPNINSPEDLAYIMYTSGSTGQPKGVAVEQKNVIRLVKNTNYIKFKRNHKILQTGAITFDASTFEIWGALLNGLSLHLISKDVLMNTKKLEQYIQKNKISTMWLTSPLFNQISKEKPEVFEKLEYLLVGGDVLSPKHINYVRSKNKKLNIINGYGPTENTTFSTCFHINENYEENISIGKPIANSTCYVLNKYGKLQPIGIYGELYLGGDGLARGYINNEELTKEKFISNPFIKGEKVYKTGDLVRWLEDGNIEFLGRIDHQVKIRGFRIELGEIEWQLLKNEKIKESVVIAREDEDGNKYICAYIVGTEKFKVRDLREYLLKELPEYMIPSYFIQLERVPLTPNGKIDMNNLPKPEGKINTGVEYEGARNEIEEKLVEIWKDILKVEQVGINDNFFEIGGHSLKATSLVNRIWKELNIEISLKEIFKWATIKNLGEYIANIENKDASILTNETDLLKLEELLNEIENLDDDNALSLIL